MLFRSQPLAFLRRESFTSMNKKLENMPGHHHNIKINSLLRANDNLKILLPTIWGRFLKQWTRSSFRSLNCACDTEAKLIIDFTLEFIQLILSSRWACRAVSKSFSALLLWSFPDYANARIHRVHFHDVYAKRFRHLLDYVSCKWPIFRLRFYF